MRTLLRCRQAGVQRLGDARGGWVGMGGEASRRALCGFRATACLVRAHMSRAAPASQAAVEHHGCSHRTGPVPRCIVQRVLGAERLHAVTGAFRNAARLCATRPGTLCEARHTRVLFVYMHACVPSRPDPLATPPCSPSEHPHGCIVIFHSPVCLCRGPLSQRHPQMSQFRASCEKGRLSGCLPVPGTAHRNAVPIPNSIRLHIMIASAPVTHRPSIAATYR